MCFKIPKRCLGNLSWSHYLELIKIEEENKRNFYLKEAINSKWSVRELQRQKNSLLYERLALSQDKAKVLELSEKGQIIKTGKDLVKDPFVLEFLDIKENTEYIESDLEKKYTRTFKRVFIRVRKRIYVCRKSSKINSRRGTFLSRFGFLQ